MLFKKKRRRKKKQPIKTMDVILVVVAVLLTSFTITMIVIFKETGMIPDTLCTCVFAALGGECGVMGWIKTTKDRRQEHKWELEERERSTKSKKPPDSGSETSEKEENHEIQ